jgi:AraC-like DNA-binding protein
VKVPLLIRQNFRPLQPSLLKIEDSAYYREVLPDLRLQPYICCYWEAKSLKSFPESFSYKVVADGCVDICFSPGLSKYNFLFGLITKFNDFQLENPFHLIGIRFLPGMFSQFFKFDLHEIINSTGEMAAIAPSTADFIDKSFSPEQKLEVIKGSLDMYMLKRLFSVNPDFDNRLFNSVNIILEKKGVFNPDKIMDLGISARHLRRVFKNYIGCSPKAFSKIVRFQNILRAAPSVDILRESNIFYDLGYYDQSHFIKEFKTFYGITPKTAFEI